MPSNTDSRLTSMLVVCCAVFLSFAFTLVRAAAAAEQAGRLVGQLAGPVKVVMFSPNGSRVATFAYGEGQVWDAKTLMPVHGRLALRAFGGSAAFSPDGKRLITGHYEPRAVVWDVDSGKELLTLRHDKGPPKPVATEGNVDSVSAVAYSPDGGKIATGGDDRTARLWNASSGKELRVLRHEASVRFVAFSPDGTRVVTLTSGFLSDIDHMRPATVRLWDVETGRELWRKAAADSWTDRVSFRPDGKRVAASLESYRDERPDGVPNYRFAGERVFVWDAASGEERLTIEPPKDVGPQVKVAFAADGKRLVVAGQTGAVLLDATTGAAASPTFDAGWHCRAILSPGGRLLLTSGEWGHAALWDAVTGERPLDLGAGKVRKEDEEVNDRPAIALSPDGNRIAVGYPLENYTTVRELTFDPNK